MFQLEEGNFAIYFIDKPLKPCGTPISVYYCKSVLIEKLGDDTLVVVASGKSPANNCPQCIIPWDNISAIIDWSEVKEIAR